jgi:small subunit ribosomal protein S11
MAEEKKPGEESSNTIAEEVKVNVSDVESAPEEKKPDTEVAAEKTASKPEKKKDIFAAIEGDGEETKPARKMKGAKNVPYGIAFIKTTFNNTIVSLTDMRGQVISWSSAGRCGFKGSRKSTAFAATTVAQEAARGAISHGMNEVEVRVQGPGAGRESAVRAIQAAGLRVSSIKDTTPVPHNGCRPKKQRRV